MTEENIQEQLPSELIKFEVIRKGKEGLLRISEFHDEQIVRTVNVALISGNVTEFGKGMAALIDKQQLLRLLWPKQEDLQ